jgi:hypothetical protein
MGRPVRGQYRILSTTAMWRAGRQIGLHRDGGGRGGSIWTRSGSEPPAEAGEVGFGAEPLWVVADGDERSTGRVHADGEDGERLRRHEGHELGDLALEPRISRAARRSPD